MHLAIHNQSKDNLDEDELYQNGTRGELVDADRGPSPDTSASITEHFEAIEVDEKLDAGDLLDDSDHEEGVQDERDEMEIDDCTSRAYSVAECVIDDIFTRVTRHCGTRRYSR